MLYVNFKSLCHILSEIQLFKIFKVKLWPWYSLDRDHHLTSLKQSHYLCYISISSLYVRYFSKYKSSKFSRSSCDLDIHRTVTNIELVRDTVKRHNISKFEDPRFKITQVIVLTDTQTRTDRRRQTDRQTDRQQQDRQTDRQTDGEEYYIVALINATITRRTFFEKNIVAFTFAIFTTYQDHTVTVRLPPWDPLECDCHLAF